MRATAYWGLLLAALMAPLPAAVPMDGVSATHILVSHGNPPLDVPPVLRHTGATVVGLVGGGIVGAVARRVLPSDVDKRAMARQRPAIADLAHDPAIAQWADQFQRELGAQLVRQYGAPDATVEYFNDEVKRQRREVALAPELVVTGVVSLILLPERDCGNLGIALSYGSAYMKQTLDIKRRPISVYVHKPQKSLMMSSEWCLPGSRNSFRKRQSGDQKIADAAALIAILDARKQELLTALAAPPVGPLDPDRAGTLAPREFPFYVASFGRSRSWIARPDHQILRMVPNGALEAVSCSSACGPLERAMAEERARREAWIKDNGDMIME